MDWKDHIIAEPSCLNQAKAFVPYATEAFLVTLANKGLYKRALKDLETTARIELRESENGIQVTLDDVTVTLFPNVAQSTCTCPSKTVCKHILMGILSASEYASSGGAPTATVSSQSSTESIPTTAEAEGLQPEFTQDSTSEPIQESVSQASPASSWEELKKIDIPSLRKQAGKKLFEDTLRLIQDGWTADLTEGEMLEATLNTENITVYFPRQNSLESAVCKCGATGLCKHKLIAILSYLSRRGSLSSLEDGNSLSLLTDEAQSLLESADKFVVHILDKGIISCGENEVEAAVRYSIRMETCGIGNLARLFRSLSTDLENMLGKNVGFSQIVTFSTLARLHNTMRLILCNRQDNNLLTRLIESPRSDYYTTPIGHFTALGACPWQTRSGYFGITAYFFYQEKQSICTYTVSMADYYEQTEKLADIDNLSRQYQKNEHWGGSVSLASLSHAEFTLRNFKLNSQNRLSSSSQTQCELTGSVNRKTLVPLSVLPLFSVAQMESEQKYDYFQKKQPPRLVLVPFSRIDNADFNHTEQKLFLTLEQKGADSAEIMLPYNEMSKDAIRYLERFYHFCKDTPRFMVCLSGQEGLTPVSMATDAGIENFFFPQ